MTTVDGQQQQKQRRLTTVMANNTKTRKMELLCEGSPIAANKDRL